MVWAHWDDVPAPNTFNDVGVTLISSLASRMFAWRLSSSIDVRNTSFWSCDRRSSISTINIARNYIECLRRHSWSKESIWWWWTQHNKILQIFDIWSHICLFERDCSPCSFYSYIDDNCIIYHKNKVLFFSLLSPLLLQVYRLGLTYHTIRMAYFSIFT